MKQVIVIGGGAAGMMAAIGAAKEGARVTLLEQNEKTGKKIFITGKGRCNLTNACEQEDFFSHVISNGKFLYSAFYQMDNQSVIDFFENAGCRLKVERGDRVFPLSDHSSDVIAALNRQMEKEGIKVCLHTKVKEILTTGKQISKQNQKRIININDKDLDKLTKRQRQVAELAFNKNYTQRQISEELGISQGCISGYITDIIKKLEKN